MMTIYCLISVVACGLLATWVANEASLLVLKGSGQHQAALRLWSHQVMIACRALFPAAWLPARLATIRSLCSKTGHMDLCVHLETFT